MASTAGATLREPIIPLVPKKEDKDIDTVTLSNKVEITPATATAAAVYEKRSFELPKATDDEDVELILRTLKEFIDAKGTGRLGLANNQIFPFFRQCLGGTVKDNWDVAYAAIITTPATRPAEDNTSFATTYAEFLGFYLEPSSLNDLKLAYSVAVKPFKLSVVALAARLRFINGLTQYFPGQTGVAYDDAALKQLLYNMMLPDWKFSFLKSGNELNDTNYTYLQLTRYMSLMERHHNQMAKVKRVRETQVRTSQPSGNRAPGRGYGKGKRPFNSNGNGNPKKNRNGNSVSAGGHGKTAGNQTRTRSACPFHVGHSWHNCFGNPRGPNYKADFKLPEQPLVLAKQDANFMEEEEEVIIPDEDVHMEDGEVEETPGLGTLSEEDQHWLDNLDMSDEKKN